MEESEYIFLEDPRIGLIHDEVDIPSHRTFIKWVDDILVDNSSTVPIAFKEFQQFHRVGTLYQAIGSVAHYDANISRVPEGGPLQVVRDRQREHVYEREHLFLGRIELYREGTVHPTIPVPIIHGRIYITHPELGSVETVIFGNAAGKELDDIIERIAAGYYEQEWNEWDEQSRV